MQSECARWLLTWQREFSAGQFKRHVQKLSSILSSIWFLQTLSCTMTGRRSIWRFPQETSWC
ncbi:rCG44051, isoform CRA_b [Rattus norvegicus]|uniref:RCG44051, isoform CRA_b n=1 Tax=Rattus norvegicus TaxID=10116 RepID=A6J7N8_RAT|nr:rCG44051, isoform CRA_b [Rattus norvegicus]